MSYLWIVYRTATARGKAEQADIAAMHARDDGKTAVHCAKEYAGDLVPFSPSISKTEGSYPRSISELLSTF